ncbi:MAG: hypothetical protein AB7I27_09670 [Bacteriovoracaceae bacterium]
MKKKILSLLTFSLLALNSIPTYADFSKATTNGLGQFTYINLTQLPDFITKCVTGKNPYSDLRVCGLATTTMLPLYISTSAALMKEMQEVKPDALDYTSYRIASPQLEAVVEKFQATSLEQGHELSFDEVVETIILN